MIKNIISKFIYITVFALAGMFFFSAEPVHADCEVNSALFRVVDANGNPTLISPTTWYNDANPPFVYIDFQTTGCVMGDNTFELSITEYDVDEDTNPVDWLGVPALIDIEGFGPVASLDDDDVSTFDNLPINVLPSSPNFTIVLKAGDAECETLYTPNCRFYIRINDDVLGGVSNFNQTSNLKYNCSVNECDDRNWQYVTQITYQSTWPADLTQQNSTTNNSGANTNPIGISGQEIDINIQNPIGDSNMTLVSFIEKVITFAIKIGIPIIAIAIIYSGLLFVTARGDTAQLETARNAFTYAVIGGAILLGAWIFAKLIKETIESIAMISHYLV